MEEYKELLKHFSGFVREYGFKRKGAHFIKETTDVYLVIEFQKSRYSTRETSQFVINVGVAFKKILDYKKVAAVSTLQYTQWHTRICRPGKEDDWHILKAGDDFQPVLQVLKSIFKELIIPAFEKNSEIQVLYNDALLIMKNDARFLFGTVENILMLTKLYFPERTQEMHTLVSDKAKDSNDRLFISEVLRELR